MEPRTDSFQNIAIVRLSALGDVTLMLPAVETLKRARPRAHITWIIGAAAYRLLEGYPGVEFIVFDKSRGLRAYADLRRRLHGRKFDALLAMQASWRANFIYPLIAAPLKIGFDRARARDGQWLFTNRRIGFAREHLLDSFLAFVEALGVTDKVIRWNLPLLPEDRAWAAAHLPRAAGPMLAVNPGASKAEREWPVARWIEVIRAARERWGVQVVLTGGPGTRERAAGEKIMHAASAGVTNLIGASTPKQLAALLEKCDCLVAPDTGPVHLAVAVGTPVVGLYAVAPPQLSGPYLHPELVINRFPEAVRTILGRDPNTEAWTTRVHSGQPMQLIRVEEVLNRLAQIFEKEKTRTPV
ncbi:MAG TPA: glycosyltransferase family 9 protein [Candidatus Methylomirabilis sp.]|nr:glycosyltransferase family 9 protein [Candidatus Methylomirabilis sp.]